jgi:DNA helicase-2/ATP-dependent DNA helicase PcrA
MAQTFENQFIQLRRSVLEKRFSKMNDKQREAVFQTEGPVLILAGAGSGKTTVVVNRIANMVEYGNAYHSDYVPSWVGEEDLAFLQAYLDDELDDGDITRERLTRIIADRPVKPWNILAITFTNKAAGELKERLEAMLGEQALDIQASTFHSACMRILRREIQNLGYDRSFTVYDTDDSVRIIKDALKELNIQEKTMAPKGILASISAAKDQMMTAQDMLREAGGDYRQEIVAKVYEFYQKRLKAANALDFDDIIILTVKLFQQFPDILEKYRNRFRYIMVDEYQDTNNSQFLLVSLLSAGHNNICVVGDDDQSIYKFRGATIENILNFENQYRNTKVIRLEQNYRCTQTILEAANAVIEHNTQRKGKTLWTQNQKGGQVKVYRALSEQDEARFIADTILENVAKGQRFSDHAILYRMNAQSNTIENALIRSGIAYKIIGGLRFYERKEIKDIIAYLSVINNHSDAIRLKRIINEPKRGIGDATVDKAQEIADMLGLPLFEVLERAEEFQPLAKKCKPLMEFAQMMNELGQIAENGSLEELFDELLERTGYLIHLQAMGEEGINRIENVNELKTNIIKYVEEMEKLPQPSIDPDHPDEEPEIMMPSLAGFLEEVTLYTDLDGYEEDADRVIMMTMHSAKGLEFDNVFFCGAEEGIFPGIQAIYNPDQIEEERRLAYVCITRAKKKLYITNAAQRMIFGQTVRNRVSRFVTEIPSGCCDVEDKTIRKASAAELKKAQPKKTRAVNDIGVGGLGAAKKTIAYSSDAPTGAACTLKAGDRVSHKTFGEGNILKITPMGGDCLLEVKFDQIGVKKIMYKFAHLTKLS